MPEKTQPKLNPNSNQTQTKLNPNSTQTQIIQKGLKSQTQSKLNPNSTQTQSNSNPSENKTQLKLKINSGIPVGLAWTNFRQWGVESEEDENHCLINVILVWQKACCCWWDVVGSYILRNLLENHIFFSEMISQISFTTELILQF